jgi:hypothetical protein
VGMTDTAPPPNVWPTLTAPRDAGGLIKFLVDAFGFEAVVCTARAITSTTPSCPGRSAGASCSARPARPVPDDGFPLHVPGSFGCYVVTDDADALYKRATAAGAEVIRELNDTDYGSRDVGFRDPEGNRWSFGTYRGHPRS